MVSLGQRLSGRGEGAAVQRSGGAHEASGGAGTHAEAVAEPGGGRASLEAVLGAGGAAAVDRGQGSQPLAFEAVKLPPHLKDLFGQGGVG
jgi:hypothetical protein